MWVRVWASLQPDCQSVSVSQADRRNIWMYAIFQMFHRRRTWARYLIELWRMPWIRSICG